MKAIIKLDVPDYQIGQEVNIYFKDTMMIKGVVEKEIECEDAISRQAVLDAMYELCNTEETLKENPWRDNPHIDAITDAIEDLPPVNTQPKTGQWIDDKCSVCGKGIENLIDSREWYRNEEPKFCPFCGIKMEVEG